VKRNEQMILTGLAVIGVILGFWLLILSPKRNEASKLENQVTELQSSLSAAQQEVSVGEEARRSFGTDYRRLVVLGKAVPADSDQASLLVQLQNLASRSGVQFQSIDLSSSGDSATVAPATAAPADSASSTDSSASTDGSESTTTTSTDSAAPLEPALATEAVAATLPIGASVGPAGLPVMAYDLSFTGDFFEIADFMKRVDAMVHMRDGLVDVQGRLLTVNGFTLAPSEDSDSVATPVLTASLNVTTYLTPADQGLTGGATPVGQSSAAPTLATTTPAPTDTTATVPSSTSTDGAVSTSP